MKTSLYTTVYPGIEKFIRPWCQSLKQQTDKQVDIWIGIDHMNVDFLQTELTEFDNINLVHAQSDDTPAQIRERAITEIVKSYDAVIFVDSDDILMPTRVAAAKQAVLNNQVYGCCLEIVDEFGESTGNIFGCVENHNIETLLTFGNIFGMSNTAYRSEILKQCLPLPAECLLVDWYLALCAWAVNAKFVFDSTPHMKYRQYGENIAKVLPPFNDDQILIATKRVVAHYHVVLDNISSLKGAKRMQIEARLAQTDRFLMSISSNQKILTKYVRRINQHPMEKYWWAYVAHPAMEELWKN